jgi:DNA-binding LacI/PurR family transcriptional regulator
MQEAALYIQVRDKIKEEIENGAIHADEKGVLPGQAVFAARYNVSLATVSRAISDLGKMGFVESRKGRGLTIKQHNGSTSSLISAAGNKMLHIGIAMSDALENFARPYRSLVLSGINDAAKDRQVSTHIISLPGHDTGIQQDAFFASFPFGGLDGMILLSPISTRSMAYLIEREIPYVSVVVVSDESVITHMTDRFTAVHKLVDVVMKRRPGIPPLTFLGSINNISCHAQCCAYKAALQLHGVEFDPRYISYEHYDLQRATDYVCKLIESGATLESIIACDDYMAAKLIDFLESIGRSDVIVASSGMFVGYEDKISITCDGRLREVGFNLMKSLYEIMNGSYDNEIRKFYYEPLVIERNIDG